MKYLRQALAATGRQEDGSGVSADRPSPLHGWLTVKEVAQRLGFDVTAKHPEDACREWIHREWLAGRLTILRRGRIILVDRFDLERRDPMPPCRRG